METVRFDSVAGRDMDSAIKIIKWKMGITPVKFRIIPWFQNRRRGVLAGSFTEPNEILMVADKRGDLASTPVFRGFLTVEDDMDSVPSVVSE